MSEEYVVKVEGWVKVRVNDERLLKETHVVELHALNDPNGRLGEVSIDQLADTRVALGTLAIKSLQDWPATIPGVETIDRKISVSTGK